MKKSPFRIALPVTAALAAALLATPVFAANATKDDAVGLVKKGVAAISSMGAEKAYAEFNDPASAWRNLDLYLVVYRLDGTSLAHGANAKQVGINLMDRKDIDGKEFIRERMDLAKANAKFWQDYKFMNPATKKIEPKTMYCERQSDTVVCAGVYK